VVVVVVVTVGLMDEVSSAGSSESLVGSKRWREECVTVVKVGNQARF